eukprot:m.141760 g.141760  ORF g.141760 m.141760 type:complete len:384 (-) comp30211_c0_seq1:70-1221(-)
MPPRKKRVEGEASNPFSQGSRVNAIRKKLNAKGKSKDDDSSSSGSDSDADTNSDSNVNCQDDPDVKTAASKPRNNTFKSSYASDDSDSDIEISIGENNTTTTTPTASSSSSTDSSLMSLRSKRRRVDGGASPRPLQQTKSWSPELTDKDLGPTPIRSHSAVEMKNVRALTTALEEVPDESESDCENISDGYGTDTFQADEELLPDKWQLKIFYGSNRAPFTFSVTPETLVLKLMQDIAKKLKQGLEAKAIIIFGKDKKTPLNKMDTLEDLELSVNDSLTARLNDELHAATTMINPLNIDGGATVKIVVQNSKQEQQEFEMGMTTPFSALAAAYARRTDVDVSRVVLVEDGDPMHDNSTCDGIGFSAEINGAKAQYTLDVIIKG